MTFLVDFLIGAALGAGFIALARSLGRLERAVLAGGLLLAALAYVGFGVGPRAGAGLSVELAGSLLFAAFGVLGLLSSLWFLSLGWAVHAVWDLAVPSLADVSYMPVWYAAACIGFDVVVAAYLLGRARGRLPVPSATDPARAA
ncbi:MAG: hypothetical protein JRF70_17405 [Deltaproteobacteria bacterium]|nr:hypothetical protein [Deltaproteobacteria bacterium]